jgi:hypothetical protein
MALRIHGLTLQFVNIKITAQISNMGEENCKELLPSKLDKNKWNGKLV